MNIPDRSRWMTDLPEAPRNAPLFRLAIPGSHDSATSHLDPGLGVENTPYLGKYGFCFAGTIRAWAKTQQLSLAEQLQAGIRYFDFRVSIPETAEVKEARFIHTLYGIKVNDGLRDINTFLDKNKKEVVILDFNHFYKMSPTDHNTLLTDIKNIFGDKLVPSSKSKALSLQSLWLTSQRVIVIYHDDPSIRTVPNIWPAAKIESPWANVNSAPQLIKHITKEYYKRDWNAAAQFYVSQGVMTPNASNVVLGPSSSLEAGMSDEASHAFVPWLQLNVKQSQQINICIVDFVENFNFIQTVINLNKLIS